MRKIKEFWVFYLKLYLYEMRTREEIKPEDIIKNKTFLFFKLKLFFQTLGFGIFCRKT